MYFCTDTGNLYIDCQEDDKVIRKLVDNSKFDAIDAEFGSVRFEISELSSEVAYIDVEDNENVEDENTSIIIDSILSTTSTNPVQNKVITQRINKLSEQLNGLSIYYTEDQNYPSNGDNSIEIPISDIKSPDDKIVQIGDLIIVKDKWDMYYIKNIDNQNLALCEFVGNFKGENGTSITISNVTESSEDNGNNVVTFSDGKALTVKNGKTGQGATTAQVIEAMEKETWIFTLADGSSVEKVVPLI